MHPVFPKLENPLNWGKLTPHPDRAAEVTTKLANRIQRAGIPSDGPERLYLARKPAQHRKMINRDDVESLAKKNGFTIIYPQDHSLREQFRLVRSAKFIIAPNGSSLLLMALCEPGTKLCILTSEFTPDVQCIASSGTAMGTEITVLTGESMNAPVLGPSFADYQIDLKQGYLLKAKKLLQIIWVSESLI